MLKQGARCALIVGLLVGFLWGHLAQAVMVEQDAYHVYHVTPYSQYFSNDDNLKKTMRDTFAVLQDLLEEKRTLEVDSEPIEAPDLEAAETEGLETLSPEGKLLDGLLREQEKQQQLQSGLDVINLFIDDSKQWMSWLKWSDVIPDALMVFVGGSGSKFPVSGLLNPKGSVVLALVVMPVKVRRIEKKTGLMDAYTDFRVGFTVLMNSDLRFAAATQTKAKKRKIRIGAGLIWGTDHFNAPEQFSGMMFAASSSARVFGKSLNAKLGMVSNTGLPGAVDFVFTSGAFDLSSLFSKTPQAADTSTGVEWRMNTGLGINMEGFLSAINSVAGMSERSTRRSIEQRLATAVRDGAVGAPVRRAPRKPPTKRQPIKKPSKPKPDPDLDGNKTSPGRPLT